MPTLNVGGQSVQVDDSFLKLSPDQQNATVDEIAGSLGLGRSSGSSAQQQQIQGPQQSYSQPEGYFDAAVQGIPVVGPLLQKAGAAAAAGIQPLLGQNPGTTFGQRYDANLAELQKRNQKFGQENPIGSTAAGLAGGVAATAPLMGVPAVADAMGFGAGSLIPNMLKGAGAGAAIGGTDAAVRGTDIPTGVTTGAIFGGAAPAIGKAIGAAADTVGNRITKPVTPAKQVAANNVREALSNAGLTTPEAVTQRLNGVGPDSMLLDASPQLATKAGTIAASPGEGQQIIRNAIESRAAGAPDRIIGQVDQVMGQPVNLSQAQQTIYQQAKQTAGPLYAQSYKAPVESTPELQSVLSSPLGKVAVQRARQLSLSDPTAPPSVMFNQNAPAAPLPDWAQGVLSKGGQGADRLSAALQQAGIAGTPSPGQVDVRGLHLVRQALDDMISSAQRAGSNNKSRILNAQRAVIDNTLKSVPQFAQADSIYSDMSGIRDAMAQGLKVFSNSQTPEDLAASLKGMSEAERAAFAQGGRVAIRNAMATARNDVSAARGLFAKEFNQEKLKLLLGPEGAQSILGRIGAEDAYAKVAPRIIANSETAARALEKADLSEAHGFPDLQSTINYSGFHAIPRHFVLKTINAVMNAAKAGRQQQIEAEIAKILTAGGDDKFALVKQLMNEATKRDPSGRTSRLISLAVARLPQAASSAPTSSRRDESGRTPRAIGPRP